MKFERITINPNQCNGQPCIRGMRMPIVTVVNMVAGGMTENQILAEHPMLEREDICEALLYAAEAVHLGHLPALQELA